MDPCLVFQEASRGNNSGLSPHTGREAGLGMAVCSPPASPPFVVCCCLVSEVVSSSLQPRGCSTPGSSVLHYLPEFAQIHAH